MNKESTTKKSAAKTAVKENSFPVVAIGASAGGLEAMMELLSNLPPDTGMAFIYVQHLSRLVSVCDATRCVYKSLTLSCPTKFRLSG